MRLDFVYKYDFEKPITYHIKPENITLSQYEQIERSILEALPEDDYTREELDDIIYTVLSNTYEFEFARIKTFYF